MVRPDSPDLVGDIGHRGDTTDGRPPPGIKVAPGTVQGGALQLPDARLKAVRDLLGDLGIRGDLSGGQPFRQPADPYATRRPHDLKGSWEWLAFAATLPADPVALTGAPTGQLVGTGRHILMGGTLVNTATTASTWNVYDGMDNTGTQIAQVTVPAGGNAPLAMPASGVLCETAVFARYSGGLVTGSLWIVHLWKYPFTPPGE